MYFLFVYFSLLALLLPILRAISRIQDADFLPTGHVLHQNERQVHWPRHQGNVAQGFRPPKPWIEQAFQTRVDSRVGPRHRMGLRIPMREEIPWVQEQVLEILQQRHPHDNWIFQVRWSWVWSNHDLESNFVSYLSSKPCQPTASSDIK